MKQITLLAAGFLALATLTLASGCERKQHAPPPKGDGKSDKGPKVHHHEHGEGPHGGTIADWGGGKYHVEFTVDHDKQEATVYILGSDEKTPVPLKAKDGEILLTIKEPPFQVGLKASPQKDETGGSSSVFTGKHKNLGIVREFEGTISGEIAGTPYSGDFKEEPHAKEKK